jgi:hypothetical protein
MDDCEERATADDEPTAEERPPIAEELRQMSFRAFIERSNRQFEADRAEYLAEEAVAHEDQKHCGASRAGAAFTAATGRCYTRVDRSCPYSSLRSAFTHDVHGSHTPHRSTNLAGFLLLFRALCA